MIDIRSSSGTSGLSLVPEVSQLVDYVWDEASGQLEEVLTVAVETIKLEELNKAEAALLSIKQLLKGEDYNKRVTDKEVKSSEYNVCYNYLQFTLMSNSMCLFDAYLYCNRRGISVFWRLLCCHSPQERT